MQRSNLILFGALLALVGVGSTVGFGMAYSINQQTFSATAAASPQAAVELNITQLWNLLGTLVSGAGGLSGIAALLYGWWKSGTAQTVMDEITKRIKDGNTEGTLTFAGFVAGLVAARAYFKGSPQESEAVALMEKLLPLASQVEWGKAGK